MPHANKIMLCSLQISIRWQVSEDALAIHRTLNDQSGEAWTSLQGLLYLLKSIHVYRVYHVCGFWAEHEAEKGEEQMGPMLIRNIQNCSQ